MVTLSPEPPLKEAAALTLRAVSKSFATADNTHINVLNSLSFDMAPGEMVALIGPSGCGKSTLLRLIAGLDRPTSGEILVGTAPITGPSAERGLLFQDPTLFPWLSVRGNVEAGLVARGVLRQSHAEVAAFLRLVGLEPYANLFPHQLSGGMAQRAALARALVNHPRILLLDEPLGALDQFTRMQMQDEVLGLWQARGTTMLLVTHDIDEAIYMSDRIALMTSRPGCIERVLVVDLPRPRQRNSLPFFEMRTSILELLHFTGNASHIP